MDMKFQSRQTASHKITTLYGIVCHHLTILMIWQVTQTAQHQQGYNQWDCSRPTKMLSIALVLFCDCQLPHRKVCSNVTLYVHMYTWSMQLQVCYCTCIHVLLHIWRNRSAAMLHVSAYIIPSIWICLNYFEDVYFSGTYQRTQFPLNCLFAFRVLSDLYSKYEVGMVRQGHSTV